MAKYEGQDHYLDPETGILRNRLGIADESELDEAEASFVAWRSYELSQEPIAGRFDLAHLQAIHRHLFGDVYDWAGEIRTIDLSKGNSYFANHARIVGAASPIFEKLAKEQSLKGLDTAAFSERAAYYLGEINALHPFREGNGRAQREFVNHLARANGYEIDWTSMSPEAMTQASIEAFHRGDTAKFAAFIRENIRQWPTSDQ
ncbi:MAG TPA: Fic/DOC family protein [Candidatus Competibacter sp.]|nr:Fic/DOC family protein [Candidatus Competibacter sp.]